MSRTLGAKNLSENQREDVKGYVRFCERQRYTNAEILEYLEDKNFDISIETLVKIKAEIRAEMKDRFIKIGTEELGFEHLQGIDTLKDLEREMLKDLKRSVDPIERQRLSAEIRAIRKDMAEFYSGTEVVDSVYKFMQQEQDEKKTEGINNVKKKVNREKPT